MKEVLGYINRELEKIGVPYEFMRWNSAVKYPYSTGELSEYEPMTEDGLQEKTLLITAVTNNSWSELMGIAEKIEKHFPPIGGRTTILDDGSGVAVFFSNTMPIPSDVEDLKKLQINLNIKLWKVV
ncbi:hypothetical protein [Muricomes intestini]|jgi:hypothetical protein|uniref:hypothetical protein n=1 Tax=Muricomes intestini TaxID=1796634 RepID=UPI002FE0BD48